MTESKLQEIYYSVVNALDDMGVHDVGGMWDWIQEGDYSDGINIPEIAQEWAEIAEMAAMEDKEN